MTTFNAEPDRFNLFKAVLESLIDGVMVATVQGTMIQANTRARQICRRLNRQSHPNMGNVTDLAMLKQIPAEIWRVCEALVESRTLYPDQPIIPEAEVSLDDHSSLRVRAQWLSSNFCQENQPCLLITLEDRHQSIQTVVQTDVQKYQLTPREADVWQLRLAGRSYRAIAESLYITENTVKKHIKNILSKRRAVVGDAAG